MSGPKVVHIVTREELIDICEGHLAMLEAAISQWTRTGKRNGLIDDDDIKNASSSLIKLRRLLEENQFEKIQKQVPLEIGFLVSDMHNRIDAAVSQRNSAKTVLKRKIRAAKALADDLKSKNLNIPRDLLEPENLTDDALQAAISEGWKILSPLGEDRQPSEKQRELARKLGEHETRTSLDDWIANSEAADGDDKSMIDLRKRLGQLEAIDENTALSLRIRVEDLALVANNRKALLVDSLAAEIAEALRFATGMNEARQKLVGLQLQLRQLESFEPERDASIEHAINHSISITEINQTIGFAENALAQLLHKRAQDFRQKAIIGGLADLGYEVSESMQTALLVNGRVVLRSSKSPNYGVELGGDITRALQIRTVAFSDKVDPVADVAAETEFCSDFQALQHHLKDKDVDLGIVKALGIGTTPVKRINTITVSAIEEVREITVPISRTR